MSVTFDPTQLPPPGRRFVGSPTPRIEDDRLLVGDGHFVADYEPPGVLHAAFARSSHPHALLVSIDTSAARAANGVIAVFTGEDIQRLTHPFPPLAMSPGLYTPLYWALAVDKVRMVGDPLAMVVAESRYLAEDAAELIEVEYQPLSPVADIAEGLSSESEPLWEKAAGNVMLDHTDRFGDVDAVFADADRVITERLSSHRQSNQPMETRGLVVEVDNGGQLTITAATQSTHLVRWALAALTGKQKAPAALRSFFTNKNRRTAFVDGVKKLVDDTKSAATDGGGPDLDLGGGAKTQLQRDRSFLRHFGAMTAGMLGRDDYPNVRARDVGGGFGSKIAIHREDVAVTAAAIDLGRSVKWIGDRSENLLDGGHGRDEDLTVSIAVDDDGTLRAMKVDLVIDQGAYPGFPFPAAGNTMMMRALFPGSYDFDAFELRSRAVSTNKGRYLAYRGPWANETWGRERMLDIVAAALDIPPTELRLNNMIGEARPREAMITGPTIDETLSTEKTLRRALEVIDVDSFEREREEAMSRGHLLGMGVSCYHEPAPGPPNLMGGNPVFSETARTTIETDGRIVAYTPQMPHGQGHQTTYSQLLADELGVGIDDVELVWGDSTRTPFSLLGTGGSRGGPIGGGAIKYSARGVRQHLVDRAAELLEAAASDIEITDGNIHVRGVPSKGLSFAEVASSVGEARVGQPAFDHEQSYDGKGDGGWSCATHVCFVDIDLDTGRVAIPRYVVVEDCGPIINPAIVDGQIRGAVAQAVGAVLYEKVAFSDEAVPQATTYMDYLVPTAAEIPRIEIHHLETLSPGENDFRGVGEGGFIGGPAAITNAIADALATVGGHVTEQHLPPHRILELAGLIERDR